MKKEKNITRVSTEELHKMKDHTNWDALRNMRDEDIDLSDIPALGEEFWKYAKLFSPQKKRPVTLRLDDEILTWFKKQGPGYQTLINSLLKAYVESRK